MFFNGFIEFFYVNKKNPVSLSTSVQISIIMYILSLLGSVLINCTFLENDGCKPNFRSYLYTVRPIVRLGTFLSFCSNFLYHFLHVYHLLLLKRYFPPLFELRTTLVIQFFVILSYFLDVVLVC